MQLFHLTPHPEDQPPGPFQVTATLKLETDLNETVWLCIGYEVTGDLKSLILSKPKLEAERRDELWKDTCFEIFSLAVNPSYREFNFAPSGDWACYQFNAYRSGMSLPELQAQPQIATQLSSEAYRMNVRLHTHDLLPETNAVKISLGISTVLRTPDRSEFWALDHCTLNPDFHQPKSFIAMIDLASPPRSS